MKELVAVILAAGEGKRMKSATAKILHPIAGKPLLFYPLTAARKVNAQKIIVVVGHQGEKVKKAFPDGDIIFAAQEKQLGTGHAAACARDALAGFKGDVLILCGDIPLIKDATLKTLINSHREMKNVATVLTTTMKKPTGYGRIIRDREGLVRKITEEKDATLQEKEITEINSGIYCFDAEFLVGALESLSQHNAQNEYYLTDTIAIALDRGKSAGAVCIADETEVMGINNRIELAQAGEVMRTQILKKLMLEGVSIINPKDTYIDFGVTIGKDTVIFPNTFIVGDSEIGENGLIEPGCHIKDSKIGAQVTVRLSSVIHESIIRDRATIGPFAHVRPGSDVGEEVKIGNFVEVKKTAIGKGSKASHLTYLGDATIGSAVNVGAGTITCNYDGVSKHRTIIEDEVFIGSNTELVAPVKIGRGALIGAGSTITRDVPPEHLAVSRAKQITMNRKPFFGEKEEKES